MIEQLVYIIGGLILTHIFYGYYKLFVVLVKGQAFSLQHIVVAILSILVIWQFIFFFQGDQKTIACLYPDESDQFIVSMAILFHMGIFAVLSFMIFPQHLEDYSTNSDEFRTHLKRNRRIFYFIVMALVISSQVLSHILDIPADITNDNVKLIIFFRSIMILISFICATIGVETTTNSDEIKYYFKIIIWSIKEQSEYGVDYKLVQRKIKLFSRNMDSSSIASYRKSFYDNLDFLALFVYIVSFVIITLVGH